MGSPWRRRTTGIPFYVVAPTSTIDPATATGAGIPIEERDGAEITPRFAAHNPAFDVTPAELIAAIVTEDGVHRAAVRGVAAAMSVLDEIVGRGGRRSGVDRADPARLASRGRARAGLGLRPRSGSSRRRVTRLGANASELRERRPGPPGPTSSMRRPSGCGFTRTRQTATRAMFVNARVVADTDGEVAALVEAIARERGRARLGQSRRALRRLPELFLPFAEGVAARRRARRANAGSGLVPLSRPAAFAAERQWPPYHDQLRGPLRELEREQGWEDGFLAATLTRVLATGDPTLQQELELRVEALFDSRGIAHQWGPEDGLDIVKEHRFE